MDPTDPQADGRKDAPSGQRSVPKRRSPRPALIVRRRSSIPNRRSLAGESSVGRPTILDWPLWLQLIERKRRILQRHQTLGGGSTTPIAYLIRATCSNFKLDGIVITEDEVNAALARNTAGRKFRSRTAQRIRNHIAILHSIENAVRIGQPLKSGAVVRWYTSISSGLSMTPLSEERMTRLDQVARRINSPQLRLQPAIQEIVRSFSDLQADHLFPSFNGILSRLLLRYHLGRCGLPLVILNDHEGNLPTSAILSETGLTLQLLNAIDESYDLLMEP